MPNTAEFAADAATSAQAPAHAGEGQSKRSRIIDGLVRVRAATEALIEPLGDSIASLTAVPVPGHEAHPPQAFGPRAKAANDLAHAMEAIPDDGLPVLIAGSLYLAGEALRLNGELPD